MLFSVCKEHYNLYAFNRNLPDPASVSVTALYKCLLMVLVIETPAQGKKKVLTQFQCLGYGHEVKHIVVGCICLYSEW